MGSPEKESYSRQDSEQHPSKAWGVVIFGLIGAATTTFAIAQLRRSVDWFYIQLNRVQSTSWRSTKGNSSRSTFSEEAWKRYNKRMQEEYEEEMERVQRIRRMQSVFNRERNKFKGSYERWRENGGNGPGGYNYIPREDWFRNTETSYSEQKFQGTSYARTGRVYPRSHHYTVLGLDRSRATPYTDVEIKTAFRAKAMECHPDQNQDNKGAAEEKFKEVVKSYEAIKSERKNGTC